VSYDGAPCARWKSRLVCDESNLTVFNGKKYIKQKFNKQPKAHDRGFHGDKVSTGTNSKKASVAV